MNGFAIVSATVYGPSPDEEEVEADAQIVYFAHGQVAKR
jgi:hypothetical protein